MRLFIATSLPPELKEGIAREVSALRSRVASGSWPRAETYHLTYAFLDEQPAALVPRLEADLRESLADRARFEASIGEGGFFPSTRRPRVGWIALKPREDFIAIADRVRGAVRGAGLETESRAFVPHLTIVRIKEPWHEADTNTFMRSLAPLGGKSFEVSAVSIFESRLGPQGATHTELRRVELAKR